MKIVKDVAYSIEDMIDTEVDFSSNKKNVVNLMPILDIVVYIKRIQTEVRAVKNEVFYSYYINQWLQNMLI